MFWLKKWLGGLFMPLPFTLMLIVLGLLLLWFTRRQRLGKSLMLPIAVLPAAGILLRLGQPDLLGRIETDFRDFSSLDERFHATINGVVKNRFVEDFQKVISLIFHYHYQWDKQLERHRNEAAIGEHRAIIGALRSRDPMAAERAVREHLATSKETLLASLRVNRLV